MNLETKCDELQFHWIPIEVKIPKHLLLMCYVFQQNDTPHKVFSQDGVLRLLPSGCGSG
eukprot:m.6847 g.6847  ORF g.6847 m.6847 type:complete len:59 (-) comp3592_c0_seq2:4400-4576(-)